MPRGTFTVVEVNPKHGFSRVRGETGDAVFTAPLYPEPESGEPPLQLREGDRVSGLQRGKTVSEVRWVTRVEPPYAEVERMGELLAKLEKWELDLPYTALALAEHQWRDSREHPLQDVLVSQLPTFFDWELAHPYDDGALLERLQAAMQPYLPGFVVQPLKGRAALRVEPGGQEIPVEAGDRETPSKTFVPLMTHVNALLEAAGAPVRWIPTEEDWVLSPPGLAEMLALYGVL